MKKTLILPIFLLFTSLLAQEGNTLQFGFFIQTNGHKIYFQDLILNEKDIQFTFASTNEAGRQHLTEVFKIYETTQLKADNVVRIMDGKGELQTGVKIKTVQPEEVQTIEKLPVQPKEPAKTPMVTKKTDEVKKLPTTFKDGIYHKMSDLLSGNPSETLLGVKKNGKKYFVLDEKNKPLQNNQPLAVYNSVLYVHMKSIKAFSDDSSKGLSMRGGQRKYIDFHPRGNYYFSVVPVSHNASIPFAIAGGVAGGLLAPGIGSAIVLGGGLAGLFSAVLSYKRVAIFDPATQTITFLNTADEIESFLYHNDEELYNRYMEGNKGQAAIQKLFTEML